ncbi:FHA domain-containing protein [Pseudactinotalea sp. HY160]|uniref:RDD family protein n=1 Tax=Pseudactinotalea sp. HY160 TaxID=2654490 RepID=UPI00128B1D69|nr:RDD family protein [Pseudactinotalea sp. HY160]MPV50519.1 FHA domain-containing protein [Pseudactinotalea sp. HY160]
MSVHAPQRPRYAPMRQLPVSVVHPPVGRRLLAQLCDTVVVLAPGAVLVVLTGNLVLAAIVSFELLLAQVVSEARCGATLGKWLLGLRAAKVDSLYAPGLLRAAGRSLVLGLGHLVAGLGQFVMIAAAAGDKDRGQGWHDRAARTTVLDVRAGIRASAFSGAPQADRGADSAAGSSTGPGAHHPTAAEESGRRAGSGGTPEAFAPAVRPAPAPAVPPAPVMPPVPPAASAPLVTPPPMPPSVLHEPAARQPPAAPPAPAFLRLVGEGTAPIRVGGTVFVGRAPIAPAGEAATAVAIHDDRRSLSRTHARLEARGAELVITDLGSANGTFLIAADGSAQQLESDRPVAVPAGTTFALGSKVFTVHAG